MGFFSGISKALKGVAKVASSFTGGDLLTGGSALLGFLGNQNTNRNNLDIANANNAISIDLANTAYQRRVKDLAAAGLNPMLAYQQGGAQVPSLATPTMTNSSAKGLEAAALTASINKTKAETLAAQTSSEVNSASAAKIRSETEGVNLNNQELSFMRDYRYIIDDNNSLQFADRPWAARANRNFTDYSKSFYEKAITHREYSRMIELDNYAREQGFENAQSYALYLDARQQGIDYKLSTQTHNLRGFEFNRARAESDAWGSQAGHNLLPWASTAKDVGAAGAAIGVGVGAMRRKSINNTFIKGK